MEWIDRLRFRALRIDYYDYLAALLEGSQGARTLGQIFRRDALRHGADRLRGRLARRWRQRLEQSGGDLHATWQGYLPAGELNLLRAAQTMGNERLIHTLADLARMLVLVQRANQILIQLLWPAVLSALLVVLVVLAVPAFTVPRLFEPFALVPSEYYGRRTRSLLAFAEAVDAHAPLVLIMLTSLFTLVIWSFAHWRGRWRSYVDHVLWWDVYRKVQAVRFLSLLLIALGTEDEERIRLRNALHRQRTGANPWLSHHIDRMLARLESGRSGTDILETGLLAHEHYWFLSDMVSARGLRPGLILVRDRIRDQLLGRITRQAGVLRWLMLLSGLAVILALVLWHYAVIDELRRAMSLYFATASGGRPQAGFPFP